jgi:hypothetical protein
MPKVVHVHFCAPPNAGKSSIMSHIKFKLVEMGVPVLCLENMYPDPNIQYLRIKALKLQNELETKRLSENKIAQLRWERSDLYHQILVKLSKIAERMRRGVVLFEYGLHGTVAMDVAFGRKERALLHNLVSVRRVRWPDVVIYLAVDLAELSARGETPIFRDGNIVEKVHATMEGMYERYRSSRNWIKVTRTEMQDINLATENCVDLILSHLRTARVSVRSF